MPETDNLVMTLTLAGDSLSAGNLGIPFARFLTLPDGSRPSIINEGKDGDTLAGLVARLDELLRSTTPELLIIEIGANDVLLPAMTKKAGPWPDFVDGMVRQGSRPAGDPGEFRRLYEELLSMADARGVEKVVTVTIPVLGESPRSPYTAMRRELNTIIRKATGGSHAVLADPAAAFDDVLDDLPIHSDWFFTHPDEFITDLRRIRRNRGAMPLSEERGLYLTMDGAHLNERGAELMGQVISEAIALSLGP